MLNLAYLRYSKITYFGFLVTYFATFGYIKMSYFGMKKYIFYLSLYITQVSLVLEFSRQNSTLELKLLQFFGVEKV